VVEPLWAGVRRLERRLKAFGRSGSEGFAGSGVLGCLSSLWHARAGPCRGRCGGGSGASAGRRGVLAWPSLLPARRSATRSLANERGRLKPNAPPNGAPFVVVRIRGRGPGVGNPLPGRRHAPRIFALYAVIWRLLLDPRHSDSQLHRFHAHAAAPDWWNRHQVWTFSSAVLLKADASGVALSGRLLRATQRRPARRRLGRPLRPRRA
jgi:hypothetical protein